MSMSRVLRCRTLRKAPSVNDNSPDQWLSEPRDRDLVLWKAARAYIAAAQPEPLIAEGGFWPDWVREFDSEHTAIFIIDTGDSADRLVDIGRHEPPKRDGETPMVRRQDPQVGWIQPVPQRRDRRPRPTTRLPQCSTSRQRN